MSAEPPGELEGQRSINELLDEPIGTVPVQLVLPIPNCPRPVARARPAKSAPTRIR